MSDYAFLPAPLSRIETNGVEREADGSEARQYARRDEKFSVEESPFVEERREEKTRQGRQYGDDRDAVASGKSACQIFASRITLLEMLQQISARPISTNPTKLIG